MHDKREESSLHYVLLNTCIWIVLQRSWWGELDVPFAVRSLQVCANYNYMFLWVQEDLHLARLGPPSPFILHPVMISAAPPPHQSAGLLFLPLKGSVLHHTSSSFLRCITSSLNDDAPTCCCCRVPMEALFPFRARHSLGISTAYQSNITLVASMESF